MNHVAVAPVVESGRALQLQGRELLGALYAAIRSLKLYPLENATVQNALTELHDVATRIVEREGTIELRLVGDFFFLNDARLRLDLTNYAAFSFVSGALSRHGIGVIEIEPSVARDEWAPFLSLLLREEAAEDPFPRFEARLADTPVANIHVDGGRDRAVRGDDDDEVKEVAKRTYFQTVHVAREVLTDVRLGKAVNVRRVKRAVQSIVDQVLNHEPTMLGMTHLREYDEYTFTHSVNVCILSVVIGQRLGLSRLQLYELGLGALFHDIGKMRLDPELLQTPGRLTAAQFEQVKEHPTEGLLTLFSMHGFSAMPYRAMLTAYEHHMKRDLTGYPMNRRPRAPTLFSRIVAVADGFDAGTARRSYQPMPKTPDAVLREMRDNPSYGYDPLLVKALINATGVYPVGTLVILDSFELALVIEANPDPRRMHQPIVKLLADSEGLPVRLPVVLDLSEMDPEANRPRRSIIKTTDPDKYGIRVADYFI
ncbi:MAG TPA: HD domain-containing phosphohydrolase [Longimicrobiales bacterium]